MVWQEAPEGAARLGSAPLGFGGSLRFLNNFLTLGTGDPVQDFVGRVLDAGTGAMELPGRLGGELAKGVTISQCMDCFKNQFRPHDVSSCEMNDLYGASFGPTIQSGKSSRWEPTSYLAAGLYAFDALDEKFGSILSAPGTTLKGHTTIH